MAYPAPAPGAAFSGVSLEAAFAAIVVGVNHAKNVITSNPERGALGA